MTTHSDTLASATAPRPSGIHRFFREQLMDKLQSLEHGTLTISDPFSTVTLGQESQTLPALHCSLNVNDTRFYRQIALGGSLGAAESYMAGQWDSPDLTGLLRLLVRNVDLLDEVEGGWSWLSNTLAWFNHKRNANSETGSRRNIHAHYDLGNEFFALFLDDSLTYSCGIFATDSATMLDASTAKLDRICQKLELHPGLHVLEIGSGWGSFALHAARNYGCRVTTTTISKEQYDLAKARIDAAGLSDRIEIVLEDYRKLTGQYDRLASIEMIEAVGHEYLPVYFEHCSRLLRPNGKMVIQAISMPDQRYNQYLRSTDFIRSMVFPGSCCPSLDAMLSASRDKSDLSLIHAEDIAPHYARTLRIWRLRFEENLEAVREQGFDEAFIRLWRFYLCYCEAGFEERYLRTLQLSFSKPAYRGMLSLGSGQG